MGNSTFPVSYTHLINLVPIFSMILAVPVLGETLKPVKVLTAGIIIAGVWICQFSIGEKKEEHGI